MKRVAATPRLFEPTKRSDDRADYYLGSSSIPQCEHHVLVFTSEWTGTRPPVGTGVKKYEI